MTAETSMTTFSFTTQTGKFLLRKSILEDSKEIEF